MSENGEGNQLNSENLNERIRRMYDAGLPDALIAHELNVSLDTVKSHRVKLGLHPMTSKQSRLAREEYGRTHPSRGDLQFPDQPLDLEDGSE